MSAADTFIAACVQMQSGEDVAANTSRALSLASEAAAKGAHFISLPENVFCVAGSRETLLAAAALPEEHSGLRAFRDFARAKRAWVLIGSVAVRVPGQEKLANRSFLMNDGGEIAATYDKIHLFDVQVPGGETHAESSRFHSGDRAVAAPLPWARLGMTICYDLRFPHLYRALAKAGAEVLAVPSAFTYVTGQAHWHTLLRARAIENGCYVIAPAQCGHHAGGRRTYGHSLIIGPWGDVLAEASEDREEVIVAEIDIRKVAKVRAGLPSLAHDRIFTARNES